MAIGDQADMLARLKATLPTRWFPDSVPVLDGLLSGLAWSWHWLYGLLSGVRAQARIATATGAFLDMIARDYFGSSIERMPGQSDGSFRRRILAELLRERATRSAVIGVLVDLTGRAPSIFEPALTTDTGGYTLGGIGFGAGGGWGSLNMPFQCFVTAYRPSGGAIGGVAGWGRGGWGAGASSWASLTATPNDVTDAEIYAAVASVMPAASTAWTRITD